MPSPKLLDQIFSNKVLLKAQTVTIIVGTSLKVIVAISPFQKCYKIARSESLLLIIDDFCGLITFSSNHAWHCITKKKKNVIVLMKNY